jgi:hypothetical protein
MMQQIKPNPGTRRGAKPRRRPSVAECSELQQQVTELAGQQAAISKVLLSIANSPHELEPIFGTIIANAMFRINYFDLLSVAPRLAR